MEKKKSNSKKSSSTNKKTTTAAKKSNTTVKTTKSSNVKKSTVDLKKVREEEKPKVDLIKVEKSNKKVMPKGFDKIKYLVFALGFLIIAIGILFNNVFVETEMFGIVLGDLVIPIKLIGFLIIGVMGVTVAVRSKKHQLIKSLSVVLLMAIIGAWIFPNGSLSGSSFVDSGSYGLTFNDVASLAYNGFYMCIDKILILIFMTVFYKVAEATGAYHKIVDKIAKKLKGKKQIVSIVIATCIIVLMSFMTESYIVLCFLPFLISILSKLKVDKITSFAVTFGALIVGMIGSPYGTEALSGFNYYASLSIENAFIYRVILQVVLIILFALFVFIRMNGDSKAENCEEQLLTETEYGKVDALPLMIIMIITALFFIVGYIDWFTNFEIEAFTTLHTSLFEFTVPFTEFVPMTFLFGDSTAVSVIGSFTIFDALMIITIMIIIMVAAYRIKFDKFVECVTSAVKFLIKPLIVIVLITSIFTVGYMTQFMASIAQYMFELTTEFNPFTSSFVAALSGVFHNDLAFTGYVYSAYFAEKYTAVADVLSITFTSISALVQLVIPTSPLLIGLYYTGVSYKKWLKYIALFFAAVFVVILMLVTTVYFIG